MKTLNLKGKLWFRGWESTRGESSRNTKLTEDDVRAIRASSLTHEKLAKRYGVGRRQIGKIKQRKAWGHVES